MQEDSGRYCSLSRTHNADRDESPCTFAMVLFALIYVFDEVLNGLFGTNFIGVLLLLFWSSIQTMRRGSVLRLRPAYFLFYAVIFFASLAAFVQPLGCNAEAKGIVSLMFLGCLILFFQRINLCCIIQDGRATRLIFLMVLVLLVIDSVGLGARSMAFGYSLGSGPYSEPSHLAIYLLPVVALCLLTSSEKLPWITLFAALALAPSSTLLLGMLGILTVYAIGASKIHTKQIWILFASLLVLLIFVATGAIDSAHTMNRVSGIFGGSDGSVVSSENLSSIVWLNGWSQAAQTFIMSSWLGVGFNQMGCGVYSMVGRFSPLLQDNLGVVLNSEDGSFLASKLISELGLVGLLIVIYFTVRSLPAILHIRTSRTFPDRQERLLNTVRAVGGLTLLSYLYVRGIGYFQMPLLLAVAMLLCLKRYKLQ